MIRRFGHVLAICLLVLLAWHCQSRPDSESRETLLAELDSLSGIAETAEDSTEIVERLESYFLSLTADDSLAEVLRGQDGHDPSGLSGQRTPENP